MKDGLPLVVAYGGGVNSTAMLVEFHRRGIMPDIILFADTGGERPETYAALEAVSKWAQSRGMPAIITVKKVRKDGSVLTLEQNCLENKMLPSIAYGYKTCSQKYKVAPQDKFCNSWQPALDCWESGQKAVKAIGYDAGEQRRAHIPSDDKYTYWYPLIEWDIWREDCVEICKSEGLPTAKSSCFFCPSMKRSEILELARLHPDLAKRAIELENNAQLTSVKGLGRNYSWADFLKNEKDQMRLWPDYEAPEIPCGCYDG
jgi:hypothetical protein